MAKSLVCIKSIKKNALAVIAHPDDEVIFMGGTIAEFKKWSWRVLCVTDCDARFNSRRQKELLAVSRLYRKNGVAFKPYMLGMVKKNGRFSKEEMLCRINAFICTHDMPDIVFTHNKNGEYGHKTHKMVNRAVKMAGLGNVYTFSFGLGQKIGNNRQECVRLSKRSISIKKRAIGLYLKGSQKTNLSRMKPLVDFAISAKEERFINTLDKRFFG